MTFQQGPVIPVVPPVLEQAPVDIPAAVMDRMVSPEERLALEIAANLKKDPKYYNCREEGWDGKEKCHMKWCSKTECKAHPGA